MTNPNTYNGSAESDNSPTGFDTLNEVPFAGGEFIDPIPEELKDVPEKIARICLKERAVMEDPANRHKNAYNIYAVDTVYQDAEEFSPKSEKYKPVFKSIIDAPDFWNPERVELQEYGIECQFKNTVSLSESMRQAERELGIPPTIYALSGISAAGKTTACKKVGFPGMIYETKENGEKGDPIGTLATDNSKSYLWMAGGSCDQIHAESSMMMRKIDKRWSQYVAEKGGDCSEVRDKTFSEQKDVEEIIKNAQETGRSIDDLDIDVPFVVSAVGVMMRPKGSHEPHPAFKYLSDNYISMKETRYTKLHDLYLNSGLDVSYSLLCYDYKSDPKERQREAARYVKKEDGTLHLDIIDQELYDQAVIPMRSAEEYGPGRTEVVRQKFLEEAADIGNQLLTQEFIDKYCETFINPDDEDYIKVVQERLGVYLDDEHPRTIAEILNDNAKA